MNLRKKAIITVLVISVITVLFFAFCMPRKTYSNRTKAVICLDDKVGTKQKLTAENEIVLDECREYITDYDDEKQTILYVNNDGDIVEQDRRTGMQTIISFSELGINIEDGMEAHNLQYAPGGMSFVLEESLYLWERDTRKITKVLDSCVGSDGYNTYEWCGADKVYFLSQGSWFDLNVWNRKNGEIEVLQSAVRNFTMGDNEDMIYQISYDTKYYEGLIDMKYKIVELNVGNGKSRQLSKFKSEDFFMAIVDDRYLYYVQKSSYRKMSKIFCYDLATGEKECVYRTDKEVVNIIK